MLRFDSKICPGSQDAGPICHQQHCNSTAHMVKIITISRASVTGGKSELKLQTIRAMTAEETRFTRKIIQKERKTHTFICPATDSKLSFKYVLLLLQSQLNY